MVDLNYTLLVQLANFLFLIIVLNALLLKPVLKHLAQRDGKISSSHEEARANAERAEEMLAGFERELADTRVKAKQIYNSLQQEGLAEQRARLGEGKAKAQQMIEKAQAEIEGDAARAREILNKEMEKLPRVIASKLLGRTL
jgi:F-type H+-transporting ATPase subunit b